MRVRIDDRFFKEGQNHLRSDEIRQKRYFGPVRERLLRLLSGRKREKAADTYMSPPRHMTQSLSLVSRVNASGAGIFNHH